MNYTTPEKMGISSEHIEEYIRVLEDNKLNTHDVIISKGDHIVFEKYWAPFHKDFCHRMYSVTKSFVAIAIGFLRQDGKLDLDDPISKYFPEELAGQKDENMKNQTIRHMLMMSTAKTDRNWFAARPKDRVQYYFENDNPESRPSGTIFEYDSSGSFVLCALVERLSGMTFIDYLREKLFDKIGVSKEASCLKCPGGHSWGDSALICKPMDLWKTARFMLNKGKWDGEQILDESYVTLATTKQIDNDVLGVAGFDKLGYGYQIWMTHQNSFFFNGMGCQFAICVPEKDIILIYNGDNQGNDQAKSIVINNFFDIIVNHCEDRELELADAVESLAAFTKDLKLNAVKGAAFSEFEKDINGVIYEMNDNPMGIRSVRLEFHEDGGTLYYTNAQGDKELPFGRCENAFGYFPEEGYSDEVGSVSAEGHKYRCAASAAWIEPQKLFIKVQIIDKYFGILNMVLGFRDGKLGLHMNKTAEDFLWTYQGYASGTRTE